MSDFKCSKAYAEQCGCCEGDSMGRKCCPDWETSNEISNAIRAMLSHIKNAKKE